MPFYRFPNLGAPHILAQTPNFLSQAHRTPIAESNMLTARFCIDFCHFETVLVVGTLLRKHEKISALLHSDRLLLRSLWCLNLNPQLGLDAVLVIDLLYAYEGIICCPLCLGTSH